MGLVYCLGVEKKALILCNNLNCNQPATVELVDIFACDSLYWNTAETETENKHGIKEFLKV